MKKNRESWLRIALLVIPRLLNRLFQIHTGVSTEYGGPGRVRFVSFFRGAGNCVYLRRGRGGDGKPLEAPGWRPTIALRGFTFYWRTRRSRRPTDRVPYGYRTRPVGLVRLTTDPNQPVC
jgi:hypothetical protein